MSLQSGGTNLSRSYTLLLAILLLVTAPAAGTSPLTESPPARSNHFVGEVVIAWTPIVEPGEPVVYRVHGYTAAEGWVRLAQTTQVYATVPPGFEKYAVNATVSGQERAVVGLCVHLDLAAPELADIVQIEQDCSSGIEPDGQSL